MDLKLTVTCELDGQERSYDLEFAKDFVSIGRHSKNDVRIPDMAIGPDHARIEESGGAMVLVDLGTGPATVVDGVAARPNVPVPLREGAEIRIGSFRIQVRKPTMLIDESSHEKTSMVAMNMVREVLGSLSKSESPPSLTVQNDNEAGAVLELPEDREYRIGRDSDCDLILHHWSISRKHAMVRRALDQVTVVDLQSKNGVTVNGIKVTESRILKNGDVVAIGHTEMRFYSPLHSILDSLDGIAPPPRFGGPMQAPPPDPSEATGVLGRPERKAPPPRAGTPPPAGGAPPAKKSPAMLILIVVAAAILAALFLFVL